ncbi:hypothetical protein BDZ45DRAFT_79729 [Acephala macrosclerotiorum]|nr:hypothetical protein BDZ45DRAFT_79729 [Acephala macrosclerotiorum]
MLRCYWFLFRIMNSSPWSLASPHLLFLQLAYTGSILYLPSILHLQPSNLLSTHPFLPASAINFPSPISICHTTNFSQLPPHGEINLFQHSHIMSTT